MDITRPLDELFEDMRVDTVVHLAFRMRPARSPKELRANVAVNVGGTENILKAAAATGVKNIIYLSSHTVYGAHPDNPIPITEEAPIRPNRGFQYAEQKAASEKLLLRFAEENPDVRVTILRCCVVMGPRASNFVTQAFFKPLLIGVWRYDPPMQFVHEDDLARLMGVLVKDPKPGIFNVAGPRVVRYSRLAKLAGKPLIFLPATIAYPMTQLAWALGLQKDSPAVGLDLIRYPIVLSTGKIWSETDYRFQFTSEDALMSFVSASM